MPQELLYNQAHKDVAYIPVPLLLTGEVRYDDIAQVIAALRNTVVGLRQRAGYTNIAAACRRCAAQPALALALIGIKLEN